MKKIILLVTLCTTLLANAQGHRSEANDLSAAEKASLQTKKMTLALALDTSQSSKAYSVILSNVEKHMAAKKVRKESDGDQKPSKEEHLKRANARLDAQIAFQNEWKAILTTPQFEQWRKMAKRKKIKGKKRHHGPKRGRNMSHKK